MSKSLLRLTCAVWALFLIACPGGDGSTGRDGRVRVVFWHAMGGPLGDALNAMIAEFEQEHPAIVIEPVSMGGYSSLSQKLMGAVQVNAPPNIAQMYESWTTQFHQLNRLIPLDSLVRGAEGLTADQLDDFYPAFIEGNSWDGELVTLPFNKSVPVFFYNIELLRKAGYDEFPGTWSGFRTMVRKLTDRGRGIWGTEMGVNQWMFGCMLRQLGGDFLDADDRPAFNSEAGVRAAQFQYDILARDSSAVFGVGYDPQNDFLTGGIACIWGTSVSWTFMKDQMTFPVGVAPIPQWDDRQEVISFGTNIGLFRTGTEAQVAASWEFVKWFTTPERQAQWAVLTSYVPARRSALDDPRYRRMMDEVPGLRAALDQLEHMSFEPKTEEWFNGRRLLGEALEKIMRGQAGVRTALDEAATLVAREMNK
ncbi:MAG TPA: ABC transporter substrate-binding protein [candidate division WOR-3 bacterium]|uniref:ABC transporter substrate-binding protein n=1 Tax=candidate division WOR-3 bacterium TaxID=2052148 RepID=A0A7V0XG40_UNCW3|nr:ABC transporter substrate-binding protein [candidate division WOR-3 bacterium]